MLVFGQTLFFLVILFLLWLLWYWFKNPMRAIYKGEAKITPVQDKGYEESDGKDERLFRDVILDTGLYGTATFTISLPKKIPERGLPCVIVVNGLDTGRKSLKLIGNHGDYALIAFEYPVILHSLKTRSGLLQLGKVRNAALSVPGQLTAIIRWVQNAPWHDNQFISMMGFSFGAEFLPAAYHIAAKEGLKIGPIVLAYGGAGLFRLFYAFNENMIVKVTQGILGALLFHPLEPESHISFIKSEILLINGTMDKLIPFTAAKKLQDLVPEPKTIINLDTDHLKPDNQALISRIDQKARGWLEERRIAGLKK